MKLNIKEKIKSLFKRKEADERRVGKYDSRTIGMDFGGRKFLTLDDTALFLGISKAFLYKMTADRAIPHYKPFSNNIFFSKAEIEEWVLRKEAKKEQKYNTYHKNEHD